MGHSSYLNIHEVLNEKYIVVYKDKNIISQEDLVQVKNEAIEKKKIKSPRKALVKRKLVV